MTEVNRRRANGQKYEIEWNSKGQPIKANRNKLISYIGVVAKANVPITIRNWLGVDQTMKNNIWEQVESTFEIDASRKKYVLQQAEKALRAFWYFVGMKYIKKSGGSISPEVPKLLRPLIAQQQ